MWFLFCLQLAVLTASGNEDSVSTTVYLAILKALERLLLTDVLSKQDAEAIIKLAVDRYPFCCGQFTWGTLLRHIFRNKKLNKSG